MAQAPPQSTLTFRPAVAMAEGQQFLRHSLQYHGRSIIAPTVLRLARPLLSAASVQAASEVTVTLAAFPGGAGVSVVADLHEQATQATPTLAHVAGVTQVTMAGSSNWGTAAEGYTSSAWFEVAPSSLVRHVLSEARLQLVS